MAWIKSKTGRVYLGVCAGITAILLARDLPRLMGYPRHSASPPRQVVPLAPRPPRVGQIVESLPPFVRAEDIAVPPPVTIKATDTILLPSGAKFSIARLAKTSAFGGFEPYKPNASPLNAAFSSGNDESNESPRHYIEVQQEQYASDHNQKVPMPGRWGGLSAANNRLIHPFTPQTRFAITSQEWEADKVDCVIPFMRSARAVAEFPLLFNAGEAIRVNNIEIAYNDDSLEYRITLPPEVRDAVAKDRFRVALLGQGSDKRWQSVVILPSLPKNAFPQGRNTPEELQTEYCFRAVAQPGMPEDFGTIAVVLIPYQKVTITGIVTKPKPAAKP